jgi:hypothetical protein
MELVGNEISTGDHFRDGVFDLQAGVHLEEEEPTPIVDEELACAGAAIPDCLREANRGEAHLRSRGLIDCGRRRLLENLLIASLDTAIALTEVDARTECVEQDLDFYVPGSLEVSLEDEPIVAEGGRGLPPSCSDRVAELAGVAHDPHALAAASTRGLDDQRKAEVARSPRQCLVGLVLVVVSGEDRHVESNRDVARRSLVTELPDRGGGRADPADAGCLDRIGEFRVLRQEPIAGMERIRGVCMSRREHRAVVEKIHRWSAILPGNHRSNPEAIRRAPDPRGDLAPIGDEQGLDRRWFVSYTRWDCLVGMLTSLERV